MQYYPQGYIFPNGTVVTTTNWWCGWDCYLNGTLGGTENISNSTSPVGAVSGDIKAALPWFWPVIPFMLYIGMMFWYADSPQRGKLVMISALVLVISFFMVFGGFISDAIFNFFVFAVAFILTRLFKGS